MSFFSSFLPIAGDVASVFTGNPLFATAGNALGSMDGGKAGPVGAGGAQNTSASGYGALPPAVQQAYNGMATQGSNLILGDPAKAAAMYTPLAKTADETTADQLSQPMTQQRVSDMAGMYMNPFTQFLMQQIKNNFQGQNSLYQNQVSGSGFAPGTTNRDFLNTAYAQGQEEQAAGSTLAGEYNTALNTGLTQQQLSIQNLLGQGGLERGIAAGTNQAPMTALQALGTSLGLIPKSSTSQGTETPNQLPNTNSLLQAAQGLFGGMGGGNTSSGGGGFFGGGAGGDSTYSNNMGWIDWNA